MAVIEAKNLSKSYGEVNAVNGIDLSVEQGEIFGILGPNGAGKTTTLEILEGLKKADSGQAHILDIDVLAEPQKAKQVIGVQLQFESFFSFLTLAEILEVFASIYKTEIDATDILRRVDLLPKANEYFKNLSGGQQRRFSLAVSLVHRPQVWFLDEPTTGLDPQSRRYIWTLIQEVRQQGATIVLTTHYMEEAEVLCDRIAIMDAGKIVALGTATELIRRLPVKNTVSFTSQAQLDATDLRALYGVTTVVQEADSYRLETADPMGTLYRLLQHAYDRKIELSNFALEQPNLEDVFIHLTGRKLRE